MATRSADLAGIYRDLGFDQAALDQGYKSVNTDPSNPSAHRFLSETFLGLPRFETASDSELLQSLLLQPLNVNPPPPRLSHQVIGVLPLFEPTRLGYNEFSPLFASDGLGLLADGFAGNFGTVGGTLLASGLYRNLSMSLGQFYSRTDGLHPDGDLRRRITDLIFQPALSDQASLFAEYRYSDFDAGDFQNRFNLANFNPLLRQTDDTRQYRVGGRFDAGPGVTFVGVWTGANTHLLNSFGPAAAQLASLGSVTDHEHVDVNSGEAAVYLTGNGFNVVAGGNTFAGDIRRETMLGSRLLQIATSPSHDQGVWFYTNLIPDPTLRLSFGGHLDELRTFVNRTEFDPKLGLSWDVLPNTTLRGAWLTTLRRPLVYDPSFRSGQTIEPTQVAGFNQFFDDFNGTRARRWGIGIDQKFSNVFGAGDTLLLGGEWSQRQLDVPIDVLNTPGAPADLGWKERFGRAYLSWLATDRLAFNLRLDWEDLHRTTSFDAPDGFSEIRMLQVPVELRYFDPTGLLGLIRTTLVREQGHFAILTSATSTGVTFGRDTFATVDFGIGWRFPGRAAIATLEFQNLLDSHFHYQDPDVINPRIFPRRTILARVTFRL